MPTRLEFEQDSFLFGTNATFIAELYGRFLENPGSVDASWASFFEKLDDDARAMINELRGASWAPNGARVIGNGDGTVSAATAAAGAPVPRSEISESVRRATIDSLRAVMLIRAHRVRGHLRSTLDPLGLSPREYHPELDFRTYGFEDSDLDREIFIDNMLGLESATLREIINTVQETYSSSIGVEYMHMQEPDQKAWVQARIESIRNRTQFTKKGKRTIYERLVEAEIFEHYLDRKFPATKRFGVEGGESLIPALEQILKVGAKAGIEEIVIGMSHRGRLNVLANVMKKPFAQIFGEFQGRPGHPEDVQGSGDVKYHLGTSADREFGGDWIHLSLTANPSHLEAVDPVVVGKVRAKQDMRGDEERGRVMGLLLHGDAAFAGQGIVAETFDLSELYDYRTGGTIHFVINNQIGFTTNPSYARSGPYCSDLAKAVQAPIFHVNGDDPEATVHVARIATEFRQRFKVDVVVDMFCYRRQGHNEADEPAFTQPLMYKAIAKHPTVREIYAKKLIEEGVLTREDAEAIVVRFQERLGEEYEAGKSFKLNKADWLEGAWSGFQIARGEARRGETATPVEKLREIGVKMCTIPEDFGAHRKLVRIMEGRRKIIEAGKGIDWATGEALAFGSLVTEGTPVRLSGQDCGRGTFSQRHAVLVDQQSEARHVPLANLDPDQARFEVIDSPLSEASVLGFEYGYTLANPRALVLWEAQFGDFANGAQPIIDQFVCSGESKWLRMSGLVMLLPHGMEGQGPEHSSARLERYLQLCGDDNIQVVNPTTPAQYFHVLRRQMRRDFRKPLIVMTPKSLLRHKLCVSRLDHMGPDTSFHRVMYDDEVLCPDEEVARVVLCSGKVYYDLFEERANRNLSEVFFLRMEQLYPFPQKAMITELSRFKHAEIVWCQEEPKNMGAWSFVAPRIEQVLEKIGADVRRPVYVGRPESASPASGLFSTHVAEQKGLVNNALTL